MAKTLDERGFREGHVVGDTIRQLYKFINEGNCNPEFLVVSPIELYEEMPAKEMFGTWGRKNSKPLGYMVKAERLRWDPAIRAIVSKGKKVSLETSRLDLEKLAGSFGFQKLGIEIQGRQISYNGEQIIKTYTRNASQMPAVDVRTISTFLPDYGSPKLEIALDTIDHIVNNDCFEEILEEHAPKSLITAQKLSQLQLLTQEQRHELRQSLDMIQVPKLIMSMQLSTYLIARTAFKARVLKMNNAELENYVNRCLGR